jgi:hypothetical protein
VKVMQLKSIEFTVARKNISMTLSTKDANALYCGFHLHFAEIERLQKSFIFVLSYVFYCGASEAIKLRICNVEKIHE